MEKQEIKLTEKQNKIITNIFAIKQNLQNEANKLAEREAEFLINLCESNGIEAVPGIEYKDGVIFVPKKVEEKEVKLKKSK